MSLSRVEEMCSDLDIASTLRSIVRAHIEPHIADLKISEEIQERLLELGSLICRRVSSQVGDATFHMIACPAGEFWMRSEDHIGYSDEHPRHRVAITQPF